MVRKMFILMIALLTAASITTIMLGQVKISDMKWNVRTGTYIIYTMSDGLIHNEVQSIEIDLEGNKWFGTVRMKRVLKSPAVFT